MHKISISKNDGNWEVGRLRVQKDCNCSGKADLERPTQLCDNNRDLVFSITERINMEVASISGSSKRARAPGSNMSQVAHCLVDGCNADLSLCRDYHRRHKVCEIHSKTAKVTIGGREQRFCQQCSRFHSLVEFDEGKRSCRKRLDGHNRRRRKPQPDSLSRNSSELVFSSQQTAGRLVSFGSPQNILPSSSSSSTNDNILLYNNQQKQLDYIESQNSFPLHSYRVGADAVVNQLQFLQPLLDASAPGSSSQKMFSDVGLNQVVDSDHAPSLLSSATPVTREFGLNHVAQPHSAHLLAHNHNMHYYDPFAQHTNKPLIVSATDSHRNDASSTPHFPEMFQHGPPPSGGSHQTLTFMWE